MTTSGSARTGLAIAAIAGFVVLVLLATFAIAPGYLVGSYDTTTVTAIDAETDEELATAEARIADDRLKRYVGLSATESLEPDEGMLFVHEEPGEYAYVMRNVEFPIDIVFADANGTITTIHEAEPESRPYTRYEGYGQYVLEVPKGFSDDHGIEEGDILAFELQT